MTDSPRDQDCRLECFGHEREILLMLSGSLYLNNCERMKECILERMSEPCESVYLYLGRLGMIDSSGLGLLVGIHVTARNRKIKFTLLSPTIDQITMLKTTRLDLILNVLSGIEAEQVRARLEQPAFAL